MGSRIAALTLVVLALGAPGAFACNVPDIAVPAEEAGPREKVDFTIFDTEPGAEYAIYVEDRTVLSGTDPDGGGVTGRFEMPDLGADSTITAVELRVTHPDSGGAPDTFHGGAPWWGSTADVRYRPRAERTRHPTPALAPPAPPKRKRPLSTPRRRAPERSRPARPRTAARARPARRTARPAGAGRARTPARPGRPSAAHRRSGRGQRAVSAPAQETPRRLARSEAPARVVESAGAGLSGVLAALALLTLACAGYGFVTSRPGREGSSSTTGISRSVRRWYSS